MKKLFLAIAVILVTNIAMAQKEVIKFAKEVHDFGTIIVGTPVTYDFNFTNVSGTPVTVETATASCGCTTPTWPQAPVMAGKSNAIKAGFNALSEGKFEKTITVKLQGVDQPVVVTIKGDVLSKDAYSKLAKPGLKAKAIATKPIVNAKPKSVAKRV